MLSFMREQGFEDSGAQETPKSSKGAAKKRGAVNSNDPPAEEKEQQYLTVAAQGQNVRKMTVMLVVLFVIGLLALLLMIRKSVPQTAAATTVGTEESKIEKAIARLTGAGSEMFKRMDQIVKKFYEFSDVEQVRVYELMKNPFEHQIFLTEADETSDSTKAELMRQQRIKQGKNGLQLKTICQTEQGNCCMINDKVLYEGDIIKGFKVRQISDDFVKLELEGLETELKLSQ
jgi:preprotein translocase subunit SecG